MVLAARATANELVTRSRGQFIANKVADASGNPRSLWRTINRLLHPGNADCVYGGRHHADVAASFSAFCCDKLRRVKNSISSTLSSWPFATVADLPPCVNDITLTELNAVNVYEVEAAIKKLPNKSSPLDVLPVSLLKLCLPEIVCMITNLANASFKNGHFPVLMKLGQITLLLKKAGLDAADDSNFRPITNLSTMSKLLERLALARLQPHLLRYTNYCTLQSAYRPLHSTETALLKVTDDIYRSMDNGSFTAVVSLDISAAFDALDHSVLSRRLQSDFSIEGTALAWIQ